MLSVILFDFFLAILLHSPDIIKKTYANFLQIVLLISAIRAEVKTGITYGLNYNGSVVKTKI